MDKIINSQQSLEAYKIFLDSQYEQHHYLRCNMKTGKQRTLTQNRALQVFCRQLAVALNDAGFTLATFFNANVDLPFTEDSVREYIWRPVQKLTTGKVSTTQPQVGDYATIYDILNRHLAEKGIYVPWPTKEGS